MLHPTEFQAEPYIEETIQSVEQAPDEIPQEEWGFDSFEQERVLPDADIRPTAETREARTEVAGSQPVEPVASRRPIPLEPEGSGLRQQDISIEKTETGRPRLKESAPVRRQTVQHEEEREGIASEKQKEKPSAPVEMEPMPGGIEVVQARRRPPAHTDTATEATQAATTTQPPPTTTPSEAERTINLFEEAQPSSIELPPSEKPPQADIERSSDELQEAVSNVARSDAPVNRAIRLGATDQDIETTPTPPSRPAGEATPGVEEIALSATGPPVFAPPSVDADLEMTPPVILTIDASEKTGDLETTVQAVDATSETEAIPQPKGSVKVEETEGASAEKWQPRDRSAQAWLERLRARARAKSEGTKDVEQQPERPPETVRDSGAREAPVRAPDTERRVRQEGSGEKVEVPAPLRFVKPIAPTKLTSVQQSIETSIQAAVLPPPAESTSDQRDIQKALPGEKPAPAETPSETARSSTAPLPSSVLQADTKETENGPVEEVSRELEPGSVGIPAAIDIPLENDTPQPIGEVDITRTSPEEIPVEAPETSRSTVLRGAEIPAPEGVSSSKPHRPATPEKERRGEPAHEVPEVPVPVAQAAQPLTAPEGFQLENVQSGESPLPETEDQVGDNLLEKGDRPLAEKPVEPVVSPDGTPTIYREPMPSSTETTSPVTEETDSLSGEENGVTVEEAEASLSEKEQPRDRSPQAWLERLRARAQAEVDAAKGPEQQPDRPLETQQTSVARQQPVQQREIKPRVRQEGARERVEIPAPVRRFVKPLVGVDPADVQFKRGAQAQNVLDTARADALTVGDSVLLTSSATDLSSPETIGLIAHELTHVARSRKPRYVPPVLQESGQDDLQAPSPLFTGDDEPLARHVEGTVREMARGKMPAMQNAVASPEIERSEEVRAPWGDLPAPWEPFPSWARWPEAIPQRGDSSDSGAGMADFDFGYASTLPSPASSAPSVSDSAGSTESSGASPVQPAERDRLQTDRDGTDTSEKSGDQRGAPPPDLDILAQQVHEILKRRLAAERRRGIR